ncbi:MAG: hypothetical protein EBU30_13350, partial [Synechococcaceae bacterium WB6_3B_236]|nr:hypothetical protein [Synechococcaceae bacterium WB6_3B_236]
PMAGIRPLLITATAALGLYSGGAARAAAAPTAPRPCPAAATAAVQRALDADRQKWSAEILGKARTPEEKASAQRSLEALSALEKAKLTELVLKKHSCLLSLS